QDKGNNTFDLVVSKSVAGIPLGLNIDYITMDEAPAGLDDNGMGIAIFAAPKVGMVDLPIRVEYISDGTSGIYGFDTGYTLTVTPTLNVSKYAFVRAEFSMVSADNKMFADKDGKLEDTKTSAAFQMGYRF
ncbi:MAG: hypothetical protein R3240_12235, partial [Gammaproteobacteria bacterium]|nr:hypothetical protein [Gammaproteobacteria bacterium]